MKTLVLCLLLVFSAFATTTTCPSQSTSSYLASNFSCVSGGLLFSGFGYQGTGQDVNAGSISVTPLTAPDDAGFQFGGWSAVSENGVSSSEESQISYTVQHPGGLIDSLSLSFNSVVTGTGSASVAEQFCLGASSVSNCPQASQGSVAVTNPGSGFSDRAFFAGVESIGVVNSITVNSGVNGSASISSVGNTFSSPEPLSFVLLGTGLLGIGWMRRRLPQRH